MADSETCSLGHSDTIAACSRIDEGRTALSQTATLSGSVHLHSADIGDNLLPVHFVPVAMEIEAADSEAVKIDNTAACAETHYASVISSSSSEMTVNDSSCLLYTSPSPRDGLLSRMPSSA